MSLRFSYLPTSLTPGHKHLNGSITKLQFLPLNLGSLRVKRPRLVSLLPLFSKCYILVWWPLTVVIWRRCEEEIPRHDMLLLWLGVQINQRKRIHLVFNLKLISQQTLVLKSWQLKASLSKAQLQSRNANNREPLVTLRSCCHRCISVNWCLPYNIFGQITD